MAQKKGYFRAEGYEVELIPMAAGLAVKTLLAGEVDVTAAGTVLANLQGAKLRVVMGFIRELPYDHGRCRRRSERVEDLRGKKIAVADRGSVTFLVAAVDFASARHGSRTKMSRYSPWAVPACDIKRCWLGTVHGVVANFRRHRSARTHRGYRSVAQGGQVHERLRWIALGDARYCSISGLMKSSEFVRAR